MQVSITTPPDPAPCLMRLGEVLAAIPDRTVACSGGIDSLLLAIVAHRAEPDRTTIAHTVTPAVPGDATSRVVDHGEREGWQLRIVRSGEFDDERYLSNPTDRCYHCKSHLYDAIAELRRSLFAPSSPSTAGVIVSGANIDDLAEYRPGLVAADEHDVRHPYVEAGVTKAGIRSMARHLGLADADLPASPCLASRLYTGTRVTASRLRAIEAGEALISELTGITVVRCRVRGEAVLVEVADNDRALVDAAVLAAVAYRMRRVEPGIASVELDGEEYRPGRAFVATGASNLEDHTTAMR